MNSKLISDLEVHQGVPDREQLVQILQNCFDGPRSHDHVEWKYDRFPDYKNEHVFFISDSSGNVIALRRLFYKQIRIDDEKIDTFIGGDSCVIPAYRGEGLFSKLLSTTTQFERNVGRDMSISFNKQGGRTFGSKLRRNWNYQSLPLFVRVFTPELVLPRYAKLALQNKNLSSLVETKPLTTIYRHLPDTLVAALVEEVSANSSLSAMRHFRTVNTKNRNQGVDSLDNSPNDVTITELIDLYQEQSSPYSVQFRRERQDIEHMLAHPYLENVFQVNDEEGLAGFAVLISRPVDSIKEGRVLDIVAKNNHIHQQLTNQVEIAARNADIDILSMVSHRAPVDNWARVDEQVMMWKTHSELPSIDTESILLGYYDIL